VADRLAMMKEVTVGDAY